MLGEAEGLRRMVKVLVNEGTAAARRDGGGAHPARRVVPEAVLSVPPAGDDPSHPTQTELEAAAAAIPELDRGAEAGGGRRGGCRLLGASRTAMGSLCGRPTLAPAAVATRLGPGGGAGGAEPWHWCRPSRASSVFRPHTGSQKVDLRKISANGGTVFL
jgi:hypothetical protein